MKRAAGSAAAVSAGPLVLNLAGCGQPTFNPLPPADDAVGLSLIRTGDFDDEVAAARHVLQGVDFSWLTPGDSVFVKVASNSGIRHPAVTSPSSVGAMAQELFDRGAGRVIVGDQAGVQQVRLTRHEERFSSTETMFNRNGILDAIEEAGAEAHYFEEHGFADGYVEATHPRGHFWEMPMMIPRIVTEVDHIISLPRLSAHALAGYTMALKSSIGYLRDDSRHHLHHRAAQFFEKFADVNYCHEIYSRMRLVFTFAPKLLLHLGPDSGTIVDADPAIALWSSNIAHHDTVAAAMFSFFNDTLPVTGSAVPYGPSATVANTAFVTSIVPGDTGLPWDDDTSLGQFLQPHDYGKGVHADRALTQAYFHEGGLPEHLGVSLSGEPLDDAVREHLESYSRGLLRLG